MTALVDEQVALGMTRLKEWLDDATARLGPVPQEILAQVDADIAAADAEVGYIRTTR